LHAHVVVTGVPGGKGTFKNADAIDGTVVAGSSL
jgi:hypothetical protein